MRQLSGADLEKIFSAFGFEVVSQRGSHMKLRRYKNEEKQSLTVPNHKVMTKGTCRTILKQASTYVPRSELEEYFYTD